MYDFTQLKLLLLILRSYSIKLPRFVGCSFRNRFFFTDSEIKETLLFDGVLHLPHPKSRFIACTSTISQKIFHKGFFRFLLFFSRFLPWFFLRCRRNQNVTFSKIYGVYCDFPIVSVFLVFSHVFFRIFDYNFFHGKIA